MNFLAHIYLSGTDENTIIGNFIGDDVKGKAYQKYPLPIQKGILLHRAIDSYTDTHPIVKKSKRRLRKQYGHYPGVIIDILYDHFLAKNWDVYATVPLKAYVNNFYELLKNRFDTLPERTQFLAHYMIRDNWLYSYRTMDGIETVLINLNKRTGNISQMHLAIGDLKAHYDDFEADFTEFFDNLRRFCKQKRQELNA